MSKMFCTCGAEMHYNHEPIFTVGRLIAQGGIETIETTSGQMDTHDFYEVSRDVWECRECGRLHIEIDPLNPALGYRVYVPEKGGFARVMDAVRLEEIDPNTRDEVWHVYAHPDRD